MAESGTHKKPWAESWNINSCADKWDKTQAFSECFFYIRHSLDQHSRLGMISWKLFQNQSGFFLVRLKTHLSDMQSLSDREHLRHVNHTRAKKTFMLSGNVTFSILLLIYLNKFDHLCKSTHIPSIHIGPWSSAASCNSTSQFKCQRFAF